ncbi:carbohydrate kinase [Dacryopinax primogenitus]|uniref:gluconokinase n=1 Tax=Dacryopinax primogenitus (strain DJM 731) TaxID=1858805 RepID=M5G130_DACPD|nr:carbohydrate kinase [Dacryopinax primogenitus]EJU03951.1 carbohydrate kinase [Dacryopinax primogenitus]
MTDAPSVQQSRPRPTLIVVMGVSGSGKSTLGAGLAKAISRPFLDGDDLHPKANVDKMSRGQALEDKDRFPWLAIIRNRAEKACADQMHAGQLKEGDRPGVVVVCSALKKTYRDILRGQPPPTAHVPPHEETNETHTNGAHDPPSPSLQTYFVFLDGSDKVLQDRMAARKGHFMKAGMLKSQLATLERPQNEEGVAVVNVDTTPEEMLALARKVVKEMVGL